MGFQILNSEGKAIQINKLDEEAAEFWGRSVDPKRYTSPSITFTNWFDTIGYQIHSPASNWTTGWNNIKCSLWSVQTMEMGMMATKEEMFELVNNTWNYLQPYFALIDHWESKGYTPQKVND